MVIQGRMPLGRKRRFDIVFGIQTVIPKIIAGGYQMFAAVVYCPGGRATKISAYIGTAGSTYTVRCAIYNTSGNLLAVNFMPSINCTIAV
jgi:hypothetical protein